MSAIRITPYLTVFTDTDGQPLEDGNVYVGLANLPTVSNQLQVYWDSGLSIPANQPIKTIGGYPSNGGTPSPIYTTQSFSLLVQNKNGEQVYSVPNATDASASSGPTDVTAYGADPSGTLDSSSAIQTAINENNNIYIQIGRAHV